MVGLELADCDGAKEPYEPTDSTDVDLTQKQNSNSIWLSLIFWSIISASSLSYVYYTTSYDKYLTLKGEEKKTVLELVSAFVSTYSGHRTSRSGIDLPVPASFRASALKRFNGKRKAGESLKVQMVGLPGLAIKIEPPDEQTAKIIQSKSGIADFTVWSNVIGGVGDEVLRTIKPVKASKPSCVSCHNKIQSPRVVWKLGDVMGAYVLDVSARNFFSLLRLETGFLAFCVIVFIAFGGSRLVRQHNKLSNIRIRMQHESERSEILSRTRKKAQSLSAQLQVSNEELEISLAKQKELNKQQRQFVSMASHEFRTPLAIIDCAMQRLKRRIDSGRLTPEDTLVRVEKIRTAVRRMTRLIESTLTAARMEEGKVDIAIAPCDIGQIVQEVCAHQQEIVHTHTISYHLSGLPKTIQADAGSLEQMLTNLLSNAVKYAPDVPDIDVVALKRDAHVVLTVSDRGLGIDEEDLDKIGTRFFRCKTSTGIAGTGIGLNLTKTLIDMHGGTFKVWSKKGEGSTFTISLPIDGPDNVEPHESLVA